LTIDDSITTVNGTSNFNVIPSRIFHEELKTEVRTYDCHSW